ncbi:hypothetical protein ACLEC3_07885 [Lonsdalea quercina]
MKINGVFYFNVTRLIKSTRFFLAGKNSLAWEGEIKKAASEAVYRVGD